MLILPNNIASKVPIVTHTDNVIDDVDRTTYTFTSARAIGDPRADRLVVVGIGTRIGSPVGMNQVLIGGITATELVAEESTSSESWLYAANVPTGTTATVSVEFASGVNRAYLGVWAIYGLRNHTPRATAKDTGAATCTTSCAAQGGVSIMYGTSNAASGSLTLTGTGVDFDFEDVSGEISGHSWGGSLNGVGGTRTYTLTTSPAPLDASICVATFR